MTPHGSGSCRERLARLEVQLDQLVLMTARLRADRREDFARQRDGLERQAARLAALERGAERTRAHLNWMKAVGLALQAALLGWLGLK